MFTSIPSGSAFRTHGGGAAAECSGVAEGDDPDTLDVVEETRPVRSTKWIFIEGIAVEIPLPVDLTAFDPDSARRLSERTRTFSVYCVDTYYSANFLGFIDVSATDPMLDPRPRITNLYNGLQLEDLAVYENAVVDRWGGLVVRNPAWLAINGAAWRTQRSNVEYWRGWELALIARPTRLEFLVDFTPDPDQAVGAVLRRGAVCRDERRVRSLRSGRVPAATVGSRRLRRARLEPGVRVDASGSWRSNDHGPADLRRHVLGVGRRRGAAGLRVVVGTDDVPGGRTGGGERQ